MSESTTILSATALHKRFKVAAPKAATATLVALDGVSLDLRRGETLGIAGESGCGKSTLGKILAGLMKPDSGSVQYDGTPLKSLSPDAYRLFRRTTQMVFQDPFSSLNPRMRIADVIAEPLLLAGLGAAEARARVTQLLETVGLPPESAQRFPDEFSGGQRQRIGIARSLAASPQLVIADEPVSSLDISIQAQIINLLQEMKRDFNLSLLIISHNLSVLRHMCDRIAIMYLGIIVEQAAAPALFRQCRHPYTEALLAAIPSLEVDAPKPPILLHDDLPSPLALPSGCRFHPRCRYAEERCRAEIPPLLEVAPGHFSACHFAARLFPDKG